MLILACLVCFSQMTLEEKVGQVLMVNFRGEIANVDAKVLIQDVGVGGFIYYNWANGLSSFNQVRKLSDSLQSLAKVPLLIAVDQEGGKVTRLKNGFTDLPGNKTIADMGDSKIAEQLAFTMGQEMKEAGINMNLAPVVDIHVNPLNPVIGTRSFGDTPEIVTTFGKATIEGYHHAGIITTLKHYPGHGDVEIDSHVDLPVVYKSIEDLEKMELLPFKELSHDTDAIMTAHILVPAIDAISCATLSEKHISYLRIVIGFQGLIVSDSLLMEGVLKQCKTVDEAAICALHAGCDLLILGGKKLNYELSKEEELTLSEVLHIHQSIVNAVQQGRIPEERINQAVERILQLKIKYGQGSK